MKATIEHSFCPYCDEVTELYFRIINTILFSTDEAELRTGMERLQEKTRLDDYFVFGYGKPIGDACHSRRRNNHQDVFFLVGVPCRYAVPFHRLRKESC